MEYDIEFEDHGQDLLRLSCDAETGVITDAAPYHRRLYADGSHFVDVSQLEENRMVWFRDGSNAPRYFRWPMAKLSLGGSVLAQV